MTPARFHRYRSALARRQPDLTLIADQVNKPQNLSAMIRTADAVGIGSVYAVVPREGYRDFRGTSRGSGQWVEVNERARIGEAINAVKGEGMQLVVAHLSDESIDYREVDYCRPTALVMGAEMQGVSAEAIDAADQHVVVPMLGMVKALNVSVAAGIILAEAQHQRRQAGLYDQPRLTVAERDKLLFRWCYPKMADYCYRNGLEYPPLDDTGLLAEPSAWWHAAQEAASIKGDDMDQCRING